MNNLEPANTDSLEEILTELRREQRIKMVDGEPVEDFSYSRAKIEAYIMDIIGEDEPAQVLGRQTPSEIDQRLGRNQLRAGQRNRLKAGCPICKANPMQADCNQANCKPKEN